MPKKGTKGVTIKKENDFAGWYREVITKAELIEYYDISGCYILRPWCFKIWEQVQQWLDAQIKGIGVDNAYFPLLVSEKALTAEKDHIEGFTPEVAWVTKSGQSDMSEPVAIRPTSETIMYPAYAKWIRSHRDLPLKLNQWTNIIRWEFKHATPFIRTREFLWQEGHTAYANKEDADKEVLDVLKIYKAVYEDVLACPVWEGTKSEGEKFPGADYTTSVEGFIPTNGRAVQAATSHSLGQNFAKMFQIEYDLDDGSGKAYVWQNSWGFTTRSLGIMIMVHGDNNGLVLPPSVAPYQVVIVPLHFKGKENSAVDASAKQIQQDLQKVGIRVHLDDRVNVNPGWKYNDWELKGVPLRLEVGPKDVENNSCMVVRRLDRAKESFTVDAELGNKIKQKLDGIQAEMLQKAKEERDGRVETISDWKTFMKALDRGCITLCPWCEEESCEDAIKAKSKEESEAKEAAEKARLAARDAKRAARRKKKAGADDAAQEKEQATSVELSEAEAPATFGLSGAAKSLTIPFEQKESCEGKKCFHCGKDAKRFTLFGRSY